MHLKTIYLQADFEYNNGAMIHRILYSSTEWFSSRATSLKVYLSDIVAQTNQILQILCTTQIVKKIIVEGESNKGCYHTLPIWILVHVAICQQGFEREKETTFKHKVIREL